MNFSNSRGHFSSFFKNVSQNKYSYKYFNSATNSKRSLINFANNYTLSKFIMLSRMFSIVNYSNLLSFNSLSPSPERAGTSNSEVCDKELGLLSLKTIFLNDVFIMKNCKILFLN